MRAHTAEGFIDEARRIDHIAAMRTWFESLVLVGLAASPSEASAKDFEGWGFFTGGSYALARNFSPKDNGKGVVSSIELHGGFGLHGGLHLRLFTMPLIGHDSGTSSDVLLGGGLRLGIPQKIPLSLDLTMAASPLSQKNRRNRRQHTLLYGTHLVLAIPVGPIEGSVSAGFRFGQYRDDETVVLGELRVGVAFHFGVFEHLRQNRPARSEITRR